jgi:adenylosuccinate lyase
MQAFVETLDLPEADKQRLRDLLPGGYVGLAATLARAI